MKSEWRSKMKTNQIPPKEYLLSRFRYDPKTGKLFTMKTRYSDSREAGNVREYDGRRIITINYLRFMRSRIVWTILKGPIPDGMHIDHIDRDPSNDRIENLRLVTHSANMWNRKTPKHNTSGINGVRFDKRYGRWTARIRLNGKEVWGGSYATKEEAARAATQLRKKHHGEYAAHD